MSRTTTATPATQANWTWRNPLQVRTHHCKVDKLNIGSQVEDIIMWGRVTIREAKYWCLYGNTQCVVIAWITWLQCISKSLLGINVRHAQQLQYYCIDKANAWDLTSLPQRFLKKGVSSINLCVEQYKSGKNLKRQWPSLMNVCAEIDHPVHKQTIFSTVFKITLVKISYNGDKHRRGKDMDSIINMKLDQKWSLTFASLAWLPAECTFNINQSLEHSWCPISAMKHRESNIAPAEQSLFLLSSHLSATIGKAMWEIPNTLKYHRRLLHFLYENQLQYLLSRLKKRGMHRSDGRCPPVSHPNWWRLDM